MTLNEALSCENLRQVTAEFRERRRESSWPTLRSLLAHLKLLSGEISRLGERALPFCGAVYHQAAFMVAARPFSSNLSGWGTWTSLSGPLAPMSHASKMHTFD